MEELNLYQIFDFFLIPFNKMMSQEEARGHGKDGKNFRNKEENVN